MRIPLRDGNAESFCYDWSSGDFVKDLTYLSRIETSARPCEISEQEFYEVVERLRKELNEDLSL
ncbi:MAG: hypothetical protein OEZ34_12325 [Spirochaetia bacterium]|nr:hypothetical protein [Spirochaetia bacterium]